MSFLSQSDTPASQSVATDPPSMGEVTADMIEEHANTVSALPADFDPAVHATNPDGTPRLRGNGEYAKKRGRKPGTQNKGGAFLNPTGPEKRIDNSELARQLFRMFEGVTTSTIGPEWAAQDNSEEKGMVGALAAYFDAKGQVNLPPEAGVIMAFGAYGFARLKHENTRSKIGLAFEWAGQKLAWAWAKLRIRRITQ